MAIFIYIYLYAFNNTEYEKGNKFGDVDRRKGILNVKNNTWRELKYKNRL